MKTSKRNCLFDTALEIGKYTLLFIFGGTLFSVISVALGVSAIAQFFVFLFLSIIWRLLIVILCVFAAGIILESLR